MPQSRGALVGSSQVHFKRTIRTPITNALKLVKQIFAQPHKVNQRAQHCLQSKEPMSAIATLRIPALRHSDGDRGTYSDLTSEAPGGFLSSSSAAVKVKMSDQVVAKSGNSANFQPSEAAVRPEPPKRKASLGIVDLPGSGPQTRNRTMGLYGVHASAY
ncbi:hypothetical protein BJ742DRAFT_820484 [Cladochytrium replicatum]|nr:hypothetical protein BJ742DRAFT_820484 [Cladochytrium replicatum]